MNDINERHRVRMERKKAIIDQKVAAADKNIGIITGPMMLWSSQQRKLGWQDALSAARMPIDAKQVIEGDWSAVRADTGLVQLLDQFPELDAVFASNDQMALGVLSAAHRIGRKVPGDLGVVGFDDTPESAYFIPPLTTIHHDLIALGQLAVRELNRVVQTEHNGQKASAPSSLMLQPYLVLRQSA